MVFDKEAEKDNCSLLIFPDRGHEHWIFIMDEMGMQAVSFLKNKHPVSVAACMEKPHVMWPERRTALHKRVSWKKIVSDSKKVMRNAEKSDITC